MPLLKSLVGYRFIIEGKAKGGEDQLLPHFGIDIKLPSSTPPRRAGEFSCFYIVKLGLLWCNGNGPKGGNILKYDKSSQVSV